MEENRDLNEEIIDETEGTAESAEEVTEEVNEAENNEENDLALVKKLKEENDKLSKEVEAFKDRLLRITAEYENFRKRTAKEKEGIYADACVEEGFDPNMHQAVMHIQDENYDKNVVAEVFLKGYKKGDKVIRYSMVKVAN